MAPSGPGPVRARRRCRRALYWVPVAFICLLLGWSYYAYVVELGLVSMGNVGEKVVCLIAYHLFFMLFVWSYWKTIFTLPMNPSKEFHLSYADKDLLDRESRGEGQQEVLRRAARDLPIYTRTMSGAIRYCDRCQLVKPDRCHHCSVCDKCILKMDHHCPWVNNCVGFSNYKFFLLFLAYSLLYCLFIAATDLQYFIKFWTNDLPDTQAKFHIMFLFFAAAMFSVSLSSLFGYHCWLVSKNKSTLEAFRAPAFRHGTDKNGFSLGFSKNMRQVFGDEKKYWLLPVFSSLGDGCSFPTCLVNQDPEQPSTPAALTSTSRKSHRSSKPRCVTSADVNGVHRCAPSAQAGRGRVSPESHHFPAKPLRESQSHLLTDTQSWAESSTSSDMGTVGMNNPALTMENET
ncbi:palmitoyltransferase ZDHHC2 isoform X1 [Tachyglossus aculeatus]|uniref:palmitoyltransferase ZDHHC2 isoform X1 n=1 Tax=Tachyglossus aculeatus TaxID=9261 RepID=UPI0018F51E17|nr:palmitoyltransferase ZDHHC2 isoform X1 [Tachyglossus aculeatus]XP_038611048.1 palmitoyltransferase ZDHHC2 isoform X1 [Tachyglossus aculeatus]XP_038611049.1 palmitoyltransferase ZDHHC2 isoform X1 [Tachyglossus aculeatus]XP_038611050.1 palmitoyltransferase ZDHHC2 isoform X1 [Tachyglossus aculeatus]